MPNVRLLLRGNRLRAARFIPFAKKKVAQLRALKKSLGVVTLTNQLKVEGGRIHLTSDGEQDRIDILIHLGDIYLTLGNTLGYDSSTGLPDWKRYYFYRPAKNVAVYFLDVDMNNYSSIQALSGYWGLYDLVYYKGYATVYPHMSVGIPTPGEGGHEWSVGYDQPAIRFKETDGVWAQTAITLDEDLKAPYAVDESISQNFLYINKTGDRYREGGKEYAYGWSQINPDFKAFLVSRDIASTNLDWDVDFVLGQWVRPGYPYRRWAAPASGYIPAQNKKFAYAYSETLRLISGGKRGRDYEIWEYIKATQTQSIVKSVLDVENLALVDYFEGFLVDHSGFVCGHAAKVKAVDGNFDGLPNNGNAYSPLVRFYTGPVDDVKDANNNVIRQGGMGNITLAFELDLEVLLSIRAASSNTYIQPVGFWRIGGSFGLDSNGNVVDNTTYGIWGLAQSGDLPTFIARYNRPSGFKLVHKSTATSGDNNITSGTFHKKIFQHNEFYYNMMTDAEPSTGLNPKVKDINNGTLVKSPGSTTTWRLPRFAKAT